MTGIETEVLDRPSDTLSYTPKVLILNDDPIETEKTSQLLRTNGYYVETMNTGAGAVERAIEGDFDVVLTDTIIGDIVSRDIYKACDISREIAQKAKETGRQTKTILTTGYMGPEDINKCRENCISDIVTKTANKDLLTSITEIIVNNNKPANHVNRDRNVLIVDDYKDIVRVLEEILEKYGITNPYCATNTNDALKMLEAHKDNIDVVVSDWKLPGIDNFLGKARAYNKGVVVMSGVPEEYILGQYSSEADFFSKFDAFLKKPFNIARVAKIIKSLSQKNSLLKMSGIRPRYDGEPGETIVVTGIYTASKSTTCNIASRIAPSLKRPLRDTSRPMRTYETNGVDYRFWEDNSTLSQHANRTNKLIYELGGYLYTSPADKPVGHDNLITIGLDGFERMVEACPDIRTIYLGVSPQTAAERLRDRPKAEQWRIDDIERCCEIAEKYFPHRSNKSFDKIILTDRLGTDSLEDKSINITSNARRLLQYIATLRN